MDLTMKKSWIIGFSLQFNLEHDEFKKILRRHKESTQAKLCILVVAVHVESLSLTSNNLASRMQGAREVKRIIQGKDPMDIEEPNSPQPSEGE
jgi:hypothetical protein